MLLLLGLVLHSIASDSQLAPVYPQSQSWQESLLNAFFANLSDTEMDRIKCTKQYSASQKVDVCRWWHVECKYGIVARIDVTARSIGQLRIQFVPPTVEYLIITTAGQKSLLRTRDFPRRAASIFLHVNKFYGRLNLATLPEPLWVLNLSDNAFTGPIALTHLPQKLRSLNLSNNRIVQSVVYKSNMPKLYEFKYSGNKIGTVQEQ